MLAIVLTVAIASVLLLVFLLSKSREDANAPPLVKGAYPIIGHVPQLMRNPKKFFTTSKAQYGGVYAIMLLWQKIVVVSSRSLFDNYYKAKEVDLSFHLGIKEMYINRSIWGDHEGALGVINVEFVKKMVREKYEHIIREEALKSVNTLPIEGVVDLFDLARKTVARITSVLTLGFDCGFEVCTKMLTFESEVYKVIKQSQMYGKEIMNLLAMRKIDKLRTSLIIGLLPLVKKARANPVTTWLKAIKTFEEGGQTLTDENVALMFNGLFFAALTNTANGVASLLRFSAEFSKETEELKASLSSVSHYTESPLLQSWVLETARISSGFLASRRTAAKPVSIGGYSVAAGTTVFADIKSSSLEIDEFPEPDTFIPTRFLTFENEDAKKYGVLNWGAGVHVCPGRVFAIAEMKGILAVVLETLNLGKPNQPFTHKYMVGAAMARFDISFEVPYKKIQTK